MDRTNGKTWALVKRGLRTLKARASSLPAACVMGGANDAFACLLTMERDAAHAALDVLRDSLATGEAIAASEPTT